MRYTESQKEQLKRMGFDLNQIDAILESSKEETEVNRARAEENKATESFQNEVKVAQKERRVNHTDYESITSIADLQRYKSGTVVRLPDFAEGQPFVARLRRPSMLVLAKQGKIPNTLLSAAGDLFSKGGSGLDTDDNEMLSQIYDICRIICEASLIEPTLNDIEMAGVELSDEQMMAIFNYSQTGAKALESFR